MKKWPANYLQEKIDRQNGGCLLKWQCHTRKKRKEPTRDEGKLIGKGRQKPFLSSLFSCFAVDLIKWKDNSVLKVQV